MNRQGHETNRFFTGTEVEHTPALGKRTLFVVGLQAVEDIQQALDQCVADQIDHIYFGANQSFPKLDADDYRSWLKWENMIIPFLDQKYWCTLDFDVSCAEGIAESGLCEWSQFIPMISVKIPHVRLMNYNATVKIDDRDFADTNPGVWCHSLHDLQNRAVFTDWSKYLKDRIVE